MFTQVLQGSTSDAAGLRARLDDWLAGHAGEASGWLGTTAGVTAEGEFIAVVRFADEASARANSERPEQGDWWAGTERLFDGTVTFHDYGHTELFLGGGSDDAGFVQMIQGTYTGDGSPALSDEATAKLTALRPEVIGGTVAWDDEGHFTETVYFSSEEAARAGEESMGADAGMQETMTAWLADVSGIRYLDLADPWMA